jgi:hypothetical protein
MTELKKRELNPTTEFGNMKENLDKNRYSDILPCTKIFLNDNNIFFSKVLSIFRNLLFKMIMPE